MADIDQINYFRERWEFVSGNSGRPNLVTFSNNMGRYFYENKNDPSADKLWLPEGTENDDFILLSDHNRSTARFGTQRIGSDKRMINGDMRTYHVADKITLPLDWTDIPSRAYSVLEGYDAWKNYQETKGTPSQTSEVVKFTVDGGAGGVEMLKWWQGHHGSFWVFLSFDGVPKNIERSAVFGGYGRVYRMIIKDFTYDVSKRSQGFLCDDGDMVYLDFWDVSMSLEEV